jgi:hypothetical protein
LIVFLEAVNQAVERDSSCTFLACTNYRHKTHNIKALYSFATQQGDELKTAFPQDTKLSHRSFQLLKKDYIEARFSDKYAITVDEMLWLAEQVAVLKTLTARLCVDHIQQSKINKGTHC